MRRLRRNRIQSLFLFKRTVVKDSEGGTYDEYSKSESFSGISWATGEDLQQKLYGAVQNDAYSIKVDGPYKRIKTGEVISYQIDNGSIISPLDGISLEASVLPEYEIRVIRPYEHLQLEVTRIDRRIGKP